VISAVTFVLKRKNIVLKFRRVMKEKIMNGMQAFSKAMFTPVLILPIAGILIAIGNIFTNARLLQILPFLNNPITKGFGTILSGSLVSILNNLGVIFCVGISLGLAKKKKAEAAFTSLLAFLVFINAMNKFMSLNGTLITEGSLSGTGQTLVLGVQILDMGVFLGVILGVTTALIHNKFIDKEFNNAFQIYGGARFVFIVLIPVVILLAVVCTFVWPFVQMGIDSLGTFINQSGNFGVFLYGALERLLIPTGLHHLVYTPFLYTKLGGTATVAGQVYEGARNIYYAEMADPSVTLLSSSVVWDARGISKMFGLIGACLAMYHTARPENRTKIKAILIPAAITSFIAGVTEPIEFSFLFVAPVLFVVHAGLSGLGMVLFNVVGCRAIGPNGFIDFLLYNLPLGIGKTRWPLYLLIGVIMFALYYVIFRFLITKFNLKTLGREDEGMEMKLHSKAEYKEKVADEKSNSAAKNTNTVNAALIVQALGGKDNIEKVDSCFTRLRLVVKSSDVVDENTLKNDTGAVGIFKKGTTVQVVYGMQVNSVRAAVEKELGIGE
jgi:PTS system, glucose-like IIB component